MRQLFLFLMLYHWTAIANAQQGQLNSGQIKNGSATILFDAFGKDTNLQQGWGFSTLIRYAGKNILFDGGSNADVLQQNFAKKNIDARSIDMIIVSHSHFDHINGIDYILKMNPRVKIYFPFDPFWGATGTFDARGQDSSAKDSLPVEQRYFNGKEDVFKVPQSGGRFWNANIDYLKESKEIAPGLRLIVSSAKFMGYFSRYPKPFTQGQKTEDCSDVKLNNLTEISLSIKTTNGEILVVGCSHSGVDLIAEQTKKETGKNIDLLMGGFHLIPFDHLQTQQLISFLKNDLNIRRVAPGHCTGHLAFKLLKDSYQENYVYAGLGELIIF